MKQGDKANTSPSIGLGTVTIIKEIDENIVRVKNAEGTIATINKRWLTPIKKPDIFKTIKRRN